ncbi:hypothetical protein SCP_0116010 [Sparassis crispa]|uniref:Uncharacterized protein n=1 Tax=Sparassis crispa TaxID=139825 RepID=A0A401G965_9APHY|nr:hypothetical protein SCP_0116010 [Sparassis crispa]GBE78710.1 hypothetical protein SCP_0116010 [Sparassis crispa]
MAHLVFGCRACPSLWTSIHLAWDPPRVRHFFELSADMLVDVYSMLEIDVEDVVQVISSYADCIRGFEYGDEDMENVHEMITSLGFMLPNLQMLDLNSFMSTDEPFRCCFPFSTHSKQQDFPSLYIDYICKSGPTLQFRSELSVL